MTATGRFVRVRRRSSRLRRRQVQRQRQERSSSSSGDGDAMIILVSILLQYLIVVLVVGDSKKVLVESLSLPSSSLPQGHKMASSISESPLVVQTINIGEYIDSIESKLLESIKNGETTKRRKLSEPNRKPMIRTLLGYTNKVDFDQALRMASNRIEYERIVHFFQNILLPQLEDSTSPSSSYPQLWKVHAPDLKDRILQAFDQSMTNDGPESSSPHSLSPFRRLATGPRYKGKILDMLQDLFPSSSSESSKSQQSASKIVQAYIEATKPLTESEILESVCESRRSYLEQTDRNHPQLLDTAVYLCTCNFDKNGDNEDGDDDGTNGEVVCPIQSGKDCEKACYEYLRQREEVMANTNQQERPNIVLQNVYIKTFNSESEKNLLNGSCNDDDDDYNNRRNRQIMHYQRQQQQKQGRKNGSVRTGTIWTSLPRKNTCSEFDNVVVNPTTNHVVEVWEAKKSISPSSLWDAITGKLSALQQLVHDDDTSMLVYDTNDAETSSKAAVADHTTDSSLSMSTAYFVTNDNVDEHDDTANDEHEDERMITFGMFGLELLPVSRAIGQLIAMCAASIVSDVNNTQTIVNAVRRQQQLDGHFVVVEVNIQTHLLHDIQILKSKYNEATINNKDRNVTIVLQILTTTPQK